MVTYTFVEAQSPEQRRLPWDQMQAENLIHAVLWHKGEPTFVDWLASINPAHAICGLGYSGSTLAGAVWVSPVMGLCGCIHFCIFESARADWRNLGSQAIAWLFDLRPFASLAAIFPANYGHVARAAKAWGFSFSPLRLPMACHMPTKTNPSRCRDAIVATLRREDVVR